MTEEELIHEDKKSEPENRLGWGLAIVGICLSLIGGWIFDLDVKIILGFVALSIGIAISVSCKVQED